MPHKAYSHHEVKYANQREYANTFVGRLVGMQCCGYLLCYPDPRFSAFSTLQWVMFFCPPPEALLLVWSTYRTGFSLLLPKKVDVLLLIMVVILLRLPMIQLSKSQSLRLMELDLLPLASIFCPHIVHSKKALRRVILRILRHKIFVRFSLFVTIRLLFFKICISLACFRGPL